MAPVRRERDPVHGLSAGGIAAIADVAERNPGLRLIVDHVALPIAARDEELLPTVSELVKLARFENVAVKASALPSYTRGAYPFPALEEPIRRVIDAFGADRVFWGSELTRLPCPYDECVRLFTEHLPFLSDRERALILGDGITQWLGWPSR